MDIINLLDIKKIVAWRRHIHMHPEVAFKEFETTAYLIAELSKYPGIKIHRPAATGLIAVLEGARPGKVIGLRADIDALPITEEADVDFASKNPGVMHACGHDCHAAMLLGAVDALYKMKDKLHGTIKFIFQHAEELDPGGAVDMAKSGLLDDVDAFFGTHVFVDAPAGVIKAAAGSVSANTDMFWIKIFGKGTHAALPEKGIDSLLLGTEVVQALNFIVSRNISAFDNAVVTIGAFNAGNAHNIVPDTAEILGTVRTVNRETRDMIEKRITDIAKGICAAYGAHCEIKYTRGYSAVINDENLCRYVKNIAEKTLPDVKVKTMEPMMGGEDFYVYGTIAPAFFLSIGTRPKGDGDFQLHHPKFFVDEDALPIGAAMYAAFAVNADGIDLL